ncbi:MAG: DUF4870 domain-containing protein [Candidatus Kerfeldbacteria bacterium]
MPENPEQSPAQPAPQKEAGQIPTASDRNILAAVSYIWIIGLILLFVKQDTFIKFHARQSVVLFLFSLIYFIPFIGWTIGWIIWMLAGVGMVVGFIMAWQGKEYRIPVVYNLSKIIKQ